MSDGMFRFSTFVLGAALLAVAFFDAKTAQVVVGFMGACFVIASWFS